MKAKPPTVEELIAELEKHESAAANGGNTLADWADEWGFGEGKTRRLIKKAVMMGKMKPMYIHRESPMRPGWRTKFLVYQWVKK